MLRSYTKAIAVEGVKADEGKRTVTAYVSIFGNRDHVGDIVHPGAFRKTIGESGSRLDRGRVPVKYNHELLVGRLTHAEEDSKGLLTVQEFASDPQSDRIFSLVKEGFLPTFSFKYGVPEGGSRMSRDGGVSTRHLTELELYEAGPVDPDLAANDATHVYGAKGISELAGALGSLSSLDYSEEWAMRCMENLTTEERAALADLSGAIAKLGNAARSIMESGEPTGDMNYEGEDEAKVFVSFSRNLKTLAHEMAFTESMSRFSRLPALLKAAG